MRWIDRALHNFAMDAGAAGADLATPDGQALIAEAVLRALPKEIIAAAITSSAHAVLVQRGIADGSNMLSREVGNNAAATVLLMLEVGE